MTETFSDEEDFQRLVAPLRRELHAHCYQMLGSVHDADDALQEALVRAWRSSAGFEGRSSVRTWLYTVVTRTCIDAATQRKRRALPMDLGPASPHAVPDDRPSLDVAWLSPYPTPEDRAVRREAVELAFVAALQHLPGNQRAALVLFEVLGFSAAEIASMMETSTASVNSALQRARRIVADKVPTDADPRPHDDSVRELVSHYMAALEQGDADALIGLLTADVTWSMPPLPHWYRGSAAVRDFAVTVPLSRCGAWHRVPVSANGQPAAASYLWSPRDGAYAAFAIDVLTVRDGQIAEITTFIGPEHVAAFGLPLTVDRSQPDGGVY